jgi:hypothetical protein
MRERGTSASAAAGPGLLACALVCALTPGLGWAQATATAASPTGIKLGEGRLHPFIEVDGRYDSIVGFYNLSLTPQGDFVVHARPGLRFELQNSSTSINFAGSGEYLFFTGAFGAETRALSRFQANVLADARFNQDGAVEVQLSDSLSRSDRTQNPAAAIGVLSLYNVVTLAVPIHPGGKALTVTPRVAWGVEFFDPLGGGTLTGCTDPTCDGSAAGLAKMNYSNLSFGLNGSWKFLPKTAMVLDVGTDVRTYWQPPGTPATVFRAQAGLLGLVSQHISVTLLAGYGSDFATMRLHTVIGNAEVSYAPTQLIKATLGYLRTLQPVPSLGTYTDDRGYLRGTLGLWAGRLTLAAQVGVDSLNFLEATTPRADLVFAAGASATVAITSWFDTQVSYNLSTRSSSLNSQAVNPPARHEVMLRLGFHY